MPKFIVTSGQSFMPFSYEELAAPVMQTAELHRATQDVYDQIGMETAALQRYINQEEENSLARGMYEDYQTKLTNLQNNLWQNGYNASTRRDLSAAKNGFSNNILRLQQAVKDRQDRSSEYHKMKLEHPDLVMGSDPGLSSLDEYLKNDRYGKDYYTYSGNNLTKEVGADAEARMKELFSNPNLENIIPGYYTLRSQKGASSQDVANARDAIFAKYGYLNVNGTPVKVGEGDDTAYNNLNAVEKVLADVLDSHIAATGAKDAVSDAEFGRLLNYAAAGLSPAIGETTFQHEKNWMAEKEYDFDVWRRQQGYNKNSGTGANGGFYPNGMMELDNDRDVYTTVGPGYDHANKVLKRNIKTLDRMLTTRDGDEVRTNLDASALVYSEAERLSRISKYGFDIGMTPRSAESKMLGGVITDPNTGEQKEVVYNPNVSYNGSKGAILTKPLGSRGNPQIDGYLTEQYRQDRATYEAMIEYYKRNYPDIYKAANIDPDERAKMYKNTSETEIPLDVPLSQYESYTMNLPENVSVEGAHNTYVSRAGSDDAEYRDKFGQYVAGAVNWEMGKNGEDDKILRPGSPNMHKGQSTGIHRWDYSTGRLSPEPVKRYDRVFKFDKKDNSITNIRDVIVSDDGIKNGYIVFQLEDGSYVGVGVEMFKSQRIRNAFEGTLERTNGIDADNSYSDEQKAMIKMWYADQLATELREIMGTDNATQKLGATKDIR